MRIFYTEIEILIFTLPSKEIQIFVRLSTEYPAELISNVKIFIILTLLNEN